MISKKMKREKEILENFMSIKEVQEGFTYIYQTKYFTFENNEYKALVVLLLFLISYNDHWLIF